MKTNKHNAEISNHSNQLSLTSKLSRFGLTLTATALCGLALSGLSVAQAASDSNSDHTGWVQVPGELIRPDCVHEIQNGAVVEISNDEQITGNVTLNGKLIAHYDACSEKPVITGSRNRSQSVASADSGVGNGWVEASVWDIPLSSNDNIDYLGNTWTVPSYPEEGGATIYFSNGIETQDDLWSLRPVIQYGVSGAGGGSYWGMASWLIGSNGYVFHSPLVAVNPGDEIFGATGMTGLSGSTPYWKTQVTDETTGHYSWITTHHVSGEHWTHALAGVLEGYNVVSCSQFPSNGRVTFYNTVVDHGFPYLNQVKGNGYVGNILSYGGPSCDFLVIASAESSLRF